MERQQEGQREPLKMILAVDDSAPNLLIIHGLLKDNFDVRLAKSGKMALAALKLFVPDLILLDIEMPGVSGFEVMDEIKRMPTLKNVPVIFVTSHAAKDFVEDAVSHGARGYVVKPYEATILTSKIYEVLNEH